MFSPQTIVCVTTLTVSSRRTQTLTQNIPSPAPLSSLIELISWNKYHHLRFLYVSFTVVSLYTIYQIEFTLERIQEILLTSGILFLVFFPNLTSYPTTLRVISSGGGLELNGFEEVYGPQEVQCVCNGFRVLGESRREERRDREGFSAVFERWAWKEMRDSYFVCMAVPTWGWRVESK